MTAVSTKAIARDFELIAFALENLAQQQGELMNALQEALPLIKPDPANNEALGRIREAVQRCDAANRELREAILRNGWGTA